MTPTPPQWAEALLRVCLKADAVDCVSGDLLEEYRQAIYPARGHTGADAWYTRQVLGFVVRSAGVWAALFATVFVARNVLDWRVPTTDFYLRSQVTTWTSVGLLFAASVWASLRSRSCLAGAFAGAATTVMAAVLSVAGALVLLAIWHDAETFAAIRGSGGLEEVFVLPILLVVPGTVVGTVGGVVGATVGAAMTRLRAA